MNKKMIFLLGVGLVGCANESQMGLKQSEEVIITKPRVVHRDDIDMHKNQKSSSTVVVSSDRLKEKPFYEIENEQVQPFVSTSPKKTVVSPNLIVAGEATVTHSVKHKAENEIIDNPYTIQVVALKDHLGFKSYIDQLSRKNPMWLNEKKLNGAAIFALLYGEFASMEEAKRELKKLPKNLIDAGAFVKSFSAIKKSDYPELQPIY